MSGVARVVVELGLDREFDYRIPERLAGQVKIGSYVEIPFGRSSRRGFVVGLKDRSSFGKLKEIRGLVIDKPLINTGVLKLAQWMGSYYITPVEHAVKTVLPSAVRKKGAAFKEQLCVRPVEPPPDEFYVERLRKRAPKQAAALKLLLESGEMLLQELAKKSGCGAGSIRGLESRGAVTIAAQTIGRDPMAGREILATKPLEFEPEQKRAYDLIRQSIETLDPPVVLLNGVTGSGKTEVYLQALAYVLEQGRGGIVLVPEISLTPQTVERFRSRFGDRIAVLHSHLSDGERHDEWHRIYDGQARVVVGARSALFAPIKDLGLIVVDEEHENSYKQDEQPRYHARDVAVMRGHMEKCAVVLGSATPALESYYNALRGKYAMAVLSKRVDQRTMPDIRVVDMRRAAEQDGKIYVLSQDLVEAIRDRLYKAEQTILFLNRRGFSSSLICPKCGYVSECEHCSVSMTYHRVTNRLVCHICGEVRDVPNRCPNPECRDPAFKYVGLGTQKVEDVVKRIFPKARVERIDADVTTKKDAYDRILGNFRVGNIDILIGTQMIAKGLHFPNVTLVGVVQADVALHMPDFRAGERTFQLLTQVAGRAGRGEVPGEVIVQTFTPFHSAIQAARRMDYDGFMDQEIEMRKEFYYPPFAHLICITIRGKEEKPVNDSAEKFAERLRDGLSTAIRLAGPAPAPLARAKGYYRYQLMMRGKSVKAMDQVIRRAQAGFRWPKNVYCAIDVDALNIL